MKQLLYTFPSDDNEFFIVAMNDRAFVGSTTFPSSGRRLLELLPAAPVAATTTTPTAAAICGDDDDSNNNNKNEDDTKDETMGTEKDEQQEQQHSHKVVEDTMIPLHQIQAVAGCPSYDENNTPVLYFAVARQSKQLCIYRVTLDQFSNSNDDDDDDDDDDVDNHSSSIVPIPHLTLHQSPKRVSSMVFADIPGSSGGGGGTTTTISLTVLVTGDLAGDAFAYSLTQASTEITAKEAADEGRLQHRRLLLGHTASMLTSVALCTITRDQPNGNEEEEKFILTADRDEKIRVTAFPSTFEIRGFLFGHTAYVSCMTVMGHHCFSCGGDSTLRVWDVGTCQELACLDLQADFEKFTAASGVPCEICVGEESTGTCVVAVIYDRSNLLHLFAVETSNKNNNTATTISERTQISLPGQPLALASLGSKFVVLVQEPHYVHCYDWIGQVIDTFSPALQRCNDLAIQCQVALPTSVLERDRHDELKMAKNVETRSSAQLMPWNDAKRKDIANASKRRSIKRRRQHKQKKSNQEEENGNDE